MEVTAEMMRAADELWSKARMRVLEIAAREGLNITIAEHDDSFLYDLFDEGEYEPTDDEIAEAIHEYVEE